MPGDSKTHPSTNGSFPDGERVLYSCELSFEASSGDALAEVVDACRVWLAAKSCFKGAGIALEASEWTREAARVSTDYLVAGDQRAWVLETVETDPSFRYRQWIVRVGAIRFGDPACATVRVALSTMMLPGYYGRTGTMQPTVPSLVGMLAHRKGCRALFGGAPASIKARELVTTSDVAGLLLSQIGNRDRHIPLIAVSADGFGAYPVDPDELARALYGMALVVALDRRRSGVDAALQSAFPKTNDPSPYRIERGVVILYRPGADPDADAEGRGRSYFTREYLERRCRGNAPSIIWLLRDGLIREARPTGVLSRADLDEMRGRESARRLQAKISELRRRLEDRPAPVAAAPALASELSDWKELAESYRADAEAAHTEASRAGERARAAELKVSALASSLESKGDGKEARSEVASALVSIPSTLTGLLDLACALWPDRIVVLPEAKRSAKAFASGDLQEEWSILRAAATCVHDAILRDNEPDPEKAVWDAAGIELAMRESGTTQAQPRLMKLRERDYDGRTVLVTPHLKGKKPANDPFRLYFAVDRVTDKIVIGHAGTHLENAATGRRTS